MPPKTLSRAQIHDKIATGDVVVIYNGQVLKLNSWLSKHPGGDKAILHMVGRDATDEINGYHSIETMKRMKSFAIGKIERDVSWVNYLPPIQGGIFSLDEGIEVDESSGSDSDSSYTSGAFSEIQLKKRAVVVSSQEVCDEDILDAHQKMEVDRDLAKYPSLDNETQDRIRHKYRKLAAKLQNEGYFECHYSDYAWEALRWVLFAALSCFFLSNGYYFASAFFLGVFWHQVTFMGHDAGHTGITHSSLIDDIIGIVVAGGVGGLSIGWWKRNHNVHHLVTNQPEHDPDIQHMPIFAITPRLLEGVTSTYYGKVLKYDVFSKVLVKIQKWSFYPIMCFGRFNLYRLSWDHLLFNRGPKSHRAQALRVLELVGMTIFFYWYVYVLIISSLPNAWTRIMYVLVSHAVTAPLHVQITLSHFAMSTASLGPQESFAQQQLRTTMDVYCPPYLDWIHGGLQFQAVHHLFPRVPRHRLREVQPLVQEFAKECGIEYRIYGFAEGNGIVLNRLQEVSEQARILATCAQKMKQEGDYGLNLAI